MENKKYDFIIVGAGLYGATFNYLARKAGYKCLIIDKRNHVGGNIYCDLVEGIPVHKYGAHIFHTSNKEIWDFVCDKCVMMPFINSPMAVYKDEIYNLPFNMNTFSKMFGVKTPEEAKKIIAAEIKNSCIGDTPQNLAEQAISLCGKTIFTKLIKEYTEKQWGRSCSELSPDIIKRIPLRFTYDNNYFNDTYQGIPLGGYNTLIDNLLLNTEVVLNTEYTKDFEVLADRIIYTGPIDEYYDYKYGKLDWRTVKFENEVLDIKDYQGNAVVNYTSHKHPYTRIIEHKHFDKCCAGYDKDKTVISKEYSVEWKSGMEPYYPVQNDITRQLYNKYKSIKNDKVIFAGRLGEYKYYDMDDTIEKAMFDFDKIHNNLKKYVINVKK